MTRINLIDPRELHTKHLVAEYRELPRVFTLARKNQYHLHRCKIPNQYVLGAGHVLFFVNKLGWLADRYDQLCSEMGRRSFVCNRIQRQDLLKDIDARLIRSYNPTPDAIELNRQRISDRRPK